jgi:hypothetical protein
MLSTSASHYLVPPPEYFWRWDVEDHAAAWDDGSTLAFARELIPLLGELSVDIGLPPLGSILLILHGAKHPDQFEQKWMILDRFARSLGINDTPPMGVARLQETSRRGLLLVGQLPDDLRNTQSARLLLLRTLFLPTPNRLPVDRSVEIVAEFRAASASQLNGEQDLKGMTRILRDLNALHVAFQNWSQESLESALRTGVRNATLDDLRTDDVTEIRETGDLWTDLEQSKDEEMSAVASLAKQLLAVIQIPRPLHRADEQPVGGVSDISNKGDPSSLLLSELAYDDDTLSVRLAYNEALYLRRESPPATPLPRRHILLDNGILLWGTSRLYATAVAVALLKPRTPEEIVILHGHRNSRFETMNLGSTSDLRVWWKRLDPSAECHGALNAILPLLLADTPEDQPEIVLVTHADVYSVLTPLLSAREWPVGLRFFIFTVNSAGRCTLFRRSPTGAQELSSVQLEIKAATRQP